MGLVFEALYCPEGGFERRVAIKRIHPHLAATPSFVDAFRAEAELSARLAHPSIVQVLDFGRVGDSFFLAMEFIDGVTLAALIVSAGAQRRELGPALVGHLLVASIDEARRAQASAPADDDPPTQVDTAKDHGA